MATEAKPQSPAIEYTPLRLTHARINDLAKNYRNAFLTDVSGNKTAFENVDFSYGVITRGYFHKADFRGCKFVGTRFIDCNFRNATFVNCNFQYADFIGTRIPTDEMLRNLPSEPNISRELLQIMRRNATSLGDVTSSRTFVLAAIAATREHLRRAWRQDGNYYREKYSGFKKRAIIGIQRVFLWLDSFLWGHGERLWKLVPSVLFFLLSASAISTGVWSGTQSNPTLQAVGNNFLGYLSYYSALFLDVPVASQVDQIVWLSAAVGIARYVAFGVLVAGLFRWLSHR